MAFQIQCKQGHAIQVAPNMQGQTIRCPICRDRVVVASMPLSQQTATTTFPPEYQYPQQQNGGGRIVDLSPTEVTPEPTTIQTLQSRYTATVWVLAILLGVMTIVIALPALQHYNVFLAPNWARALLVLTLIQLAYLVWMTLMPDWSTVWVVTCFFGVVTTLYAILAGMVYSTPVERLFIFDLYDVRQNAALWCSLGVVLMGISTYLAGKLSSRWYREIGTENK